MHFNITAILPFSLISALALASPTLQSRGIHGTVTCETSTDSPLVSDTIQMINDLDQPKHRNLKCVQSNIFGTHCTEINAAGYAKLHICGSGPNPSMYVTCKDAAEAARRIINECEWFRLAGGKYTFSNTPLEIRVIKGGWNP